MRIKRGTVRAKKRKRLMNSVKGYRWGRKKLTKLAKTAELKAGAYAYRDRRNKKRMVRRTWQVQLNAAVREHGMSYSRFIDALKKNKVELDRKVLADLAQREPQTFAAVVDSVKPKR